MRAVIYQACYHRNKKGFNMAWKKEFLSEGVFYSFTTKRAQAAYAFLDMAKFALNAQAFIHTSHNDFKCCIASKDFPRFQAYLSGVCSSI